MADIPTPTPPAPISGYRSRAINAAVAYTTATRPLAGDGVTIADGVGGKTISVAPRGLAQRAAPWQVRAYPVPASGSGTAVDWKVRVYGGLAFVDGVQLAAPATDDGIDEATGLHWYEAPELSQNAPWLCVENNGYGSWSLAWHDSASSIREGAEYRAIAYVEDDGPPPRLIQFDVGVVDLSGVARLLPFDLAIRDGHPCVYVPDNGENLVYVCGIDTNATRDASAEPTQGQDGWKQLPSGTYGVWVWAKWDNTTTGYLWGISTTDPMASTSAQDRYLLALLVGEFDGSDEEVVAQYYHGEIVCADDNGDDFSIERNGYFDNLQLLNFQAGGHTSQGFPALDFIVREERDGGGDPNAPYKVNYKSGQALWNEIYTDIMTAVEAAIDAAIENLLEQLTDDLGGSGSTIGDLIDALDERYQPICTSSTPAWGIDHGQWTTTPPAP